MSEPDSGLYAVTYSTHREETAMALTALEELLIDALNLFGIEPHLGSAILLFLKTERMQWQLVDFLKPYLDTDENPTKEQIVAEVDRIVRSSPKDLYFSHNTESQ